MNTHLTKLSLTLASLALAAVCALPAQAKDKSEPVTCVDGTTSPHGGRGACSKHGGIKKDGEKAKDAATPVAAAPPAAPAAAAKPAATAAPAAPAAAAKPASASATHAGSVNADATGATAKCKDGSYSHAKQHSGACSKHGGVAEWLDGSKK